MCRFDGLAAISFHWVEGDMRRDLDNVAAGGRKVVLDGLVAAGVLGGDGWKHVRGFWDEFSVGQPVGVAVTIYPYEGRES